MSTYILISNFMKINQDIISTYILISNFMKINAQDIIVAYWTLTGFPYIPFVSLVKLGRYPVEIDIKIRIISFWAKIVCGKQSKISCIVYSLSHHLYSQQNFDIKWIKVLEKILNETGFSNNMANANFQKH